jgi:formylglycine-generating enzyme required for sulfatase activity
VTRKDYRLPSEAEWEKGARGTDGRVDPWGNQWDATRCNSAESGLHKTISVHAYPQGASPYGLLDMAGSVWEWTRSLWDRYPYPSDVKGRAQREDLQVPNDRTRVLRGGTFDNPHWNVRCACRVRRYPDGRYWDIGFRVVMLPAS